MGGSIFCPPKMTLINKQKGFANRPLISIRPSLHDEGRFVLAIKI